MPNAVEVDIAEAIKDELNDATFSLAFDAERSEADATVPLTGLSTLRVDVVPWLPQPELDARGLITYAVDVDILIRKRFPPSDQDASTGRIPTTETDALRYLRQEITEFFLPCQPNQDGRALTDVADASWQETKVISGMVRPHFKQHRQFTAWLRVTYSISRAL